MGGTVALAIKRGGEVEWGVGPKFCAGLAHCLALLDGDQEAVEGARALANLKKDAKPVPYGYGLVAIDCDAQAIWGIQGYCSLMKLYGYSMGSELKILGDGGSLDWDSDGSCLAAAAKRGCAWVFDGSSGGGRASMTVRPVKIAAKHLKDDASLARALLEKYKGDRRIAGNMPDMLIDPPGWTVNEYGSENYGEMFMRMREAGWAGMDAELAHRWSLIVKTEKMEAFAKGMAALEEKERLGACLQNGALRKPGQKGI